MNKPGSFLEKGFIGLAILYFFLTTYYFLRLPATGGDELLFLYDLDLIKDQGWVKAIEKNISIPFMLITYPLSKLLVPVVALRVTNILLTFVLLFYFYHKGLLKKSFSFLLFYIATAGFFFVGTNDTLFFITLIIFFTEVHSAARERKVNLRIALIAIIISFFTRELFMVFLPVIILGLYLLFLGQRGIWQQIWVPLLLFIVLFTLNIPSLKENGALSYDKKSPPANIEVTWTQRQYLAQLMVNSGDLKNYQHPSWEQTQAYIIKNGKKSLPDNIISGIFQDPKLTINEFFKDFIYVIIYSSRGIGLILLISIGFLINDFLKEKKIKFEYFIPFSALLMVMIFSLIIISYIELRWLSPIFIMLIIYYGELLKEDRIKKIIQHLNLIYFCLIAVYGTLRLFEKIL